MAELFADFVEVLISLAIIWGVVFAIFHVQRASQAAPRRRVRHPKRAHFRAPARAT